MVSAFETARTINTKYNCFLEVFEDGRYSPLPGKLNGMTVAIKDVLALKDARLTCGSKFLENFTSLYSATCVERLRLAGAVFIGKTNMDEFAMGSSNENSAYGAVLNPYDVTRVPGGSSGGSAVAAATGAARLALGTDTGGSIRQPAAFTGTVGLKPTYGRISRYGLTAFASSFDTVGTFSRTLEDAAIALEVMAGSDPHDATTATAAVEEYSLGLKKDIATLRIGIPKEYFGEGIEPDIREAVEAARKKFENAGCTIVPVSLPHSKYGIAVYYILTTAEASSNLARFDGIRYGKRSKDSETLLETYVRSRSEGFGPEVKRRIMLGTYVLSSGYYDAYYKRAQKVRRLIKEDFTKAFAECDALLTPTTPTTAFKLGDKVTDPLAMYLNDIFTVNANIAGVPAISIPIGLDRNGLPIGAQLITNDFEETNLFALAKEVITELRIEN
ncbi:MAG: Asp-tRNA(Asn)/Glu-tRNA(Gln) amidotransferase subunit GatA [Bacteroidota bacterium]|nr:Asp-tRNA(Asn)/Glu-tRNA(Gln) amidotransferase subunit GatA [Bacteroidota bacterium]MDP4230807.1 Asp-tRNA(Asn)/Glu-tRNA(Gln) amidotransferase subunit GatA [Bacteroidota bacterium]MDP4235317.1 Asp-tRNA(Asn)/Glu-tRNA(Gln) amidotransferase subunit GatA [Bacteroidota bacterium]